MASIRFFMGVAICVATAGCGGQSPPGPLGVWTVRHELKQKDSDSVDTDVVVGFSTSTIVIANDGTFAERLQVDFFKAPDPKPTDYKGVWKQDGNVIRFKRDEGESTESYVIDQQGLRMTGNVAGHDIVLTRRLKGENETE